MLFYIMSNNCDMWRVIRRNRYLDLGNGSNKFANHFCNQWSKAKGSYEPIFICCLPSWTLRPAGFSQSGMHYGNYICELSNLCWWYMCVQPQY